MVKNLVCDADTVNHGDKSDTGSAKHHGGPLTIVFDIMGIYTLAPRLKPKNLR